MNEKFNFSYFSPKTDLENLIATLEKYGVAVLPGVFSNDECDHVKNTLFDYLAKNYDVHEPDDFNKLYPSIGGILNNYGLSLLKVILDMKTDDRIVETFKRIWNNEEVTMSLDALTIVPPPEKRVKTKPLRNPIWFHIDQSSNKLDKCCVQAFINLEDTDEGDGCLSVLKGSHLYYKEFIEKFKINFDDFYAIDLLLHYPWFIEKKCDWNKILAPKGSILLWDSRTIHMGTQPEENRKYPDHWRFVIYVCYTPARLQTEEDTKKKVEAYIENRLTSHWPYNVNVGEKFWFDEKINKIENLTERHKKCIGIK